jgi:hypothetical protein
LATIVSWQGTSASQGVQHLADEGRDTRNRLVASTTPRRSCDVNRRGASHLNTSLLALSLSALTAFPGTVPVAARCEENPAPLNARPTWRRVLAPTCAQPPRRSRRQKDKHSTRQGQSHALQADVITIADGHGKERA